MTSHVEGATPFQEAIDAAIQFGLPELLSFLLLWLIGYGLLSRMKLFHRVAGEGEDNEERVHKINAGISLVMALFLFVSPFGAEVSAWFANYFYQLLIAIVGVFGMVLLAGFAGIDMSNMFGEDASDDAKTFGRVLLWGGAIIGIIVFITAGGFGIFGIFDVGGGEGLGFSSEDIANIIGFVIVIGVFLLAAGAVLGGGGGE